MQPPTQETGEGYTIVMPRRTESSIYFRIIPVSLANLEYQSDGHETVRIARKKNTDSRDARDDGIIERGGGGMQMDGAPGGRHCLICEAIPAS